MTGRGRRFLTAWALAAVASGAPSTVVTLARRQDLLASTRAAGTLLPRPLGRPSVVAGAAAHVAVSALWVAVLTAVDERQPIGPARGAGAGVLIAGLDLGLVGRRFPAIAALPLAPQVADHVAFGALVGWSFRHRAR